MADPVSSSAPIDHAAGKATGEEQERRGFGYLINRDAGNRRSEGVIRMIEEETGEDSNRSLHQEYMDRSLTLEHDNLAKQRRCGTARKAERSGDFDAGGAEEFRRNDEAWTTKRHVHLIDHVAVKKHAIYSERPD